jgi:hypothetical protein
MGVLDAVNTAQDDAESTVADTSEDNGAKAVVGALGSIANPSTTEEAKGFARRFLNKELSGQQEEGEEPILSGMEKNASAARAALQKARESLLETQRQSQINDERDRYLGMAQSFGAPTKSGSFFENLSNWAGSERERQAANLKQQQGFANANLNLDTQSADVDQNVLNARLQLQKLHEQNLGAMGKESLNILGRPALNPKGVGATPLSVPGKMALDAGLTPGTPAYIQFVSDWVTNDTAAKKARAGIDTGPQNPAAHAEFATSVGVPADVPNPWEGKSTKERMAGEAIEQRKASADFAKYPDDDRQIQASLDMLDQFQALNKVTHTGPELAPIAIGGVHAGFHGAGVEAGGESGWNVNPVAWLQGFKPNIQSMNKIAANLSVLAKPQGFGNRVTNFDLQTFQKGMIGVDKAPETNDVIAQALRARLENERDWHEFEQNYYQVYGHRRGAEPAFNQYLRDNPIFDPTIDQGKAGLYKLNPNRKDYKTYFAEHNAKAFAAAAEPATSGPSLYSDVTDKDRADPALAGLSDEAIHNAKIQAQARGGSVSFAEGGSTSADMPTYKDALRALQEGSSLKTYNAPEDANQPGVNFTGEAAGAGGVVAALLALSRLGRRVGLGGLSRVVTEHPTVASSIAGGTAGAIAGGAGSKDANPGYDALTYGVTGALAGPMARYGVRGATEGLGRLADRVTGNTVNAGDRRVINAMQADNPDLNDIATRLRADARLRVPSTLADAAGPRTQGLASAALAKDTPQTADFARDLAARQEGANTRVQEKVNQALAPDPYLQKQEELTQALRDNAAPLYDAAYAAHPAVKSQALMELMNTPAGQEAAQRAFIKMQNRQLPIGQPDVTGMVQAPSLQYLDQVKRSLDDMITQEEGSGANYSATDDGHILRQMRNRLVSEVDAATAGPNGQPGPYQLARQQYAGDLEVRDALRSGNEDFSRMTPAQLQARIAQMSYAERDAFRSGVAENLFQKLNNTADASNPANKITNTPGIREKLGAIFDRPQDATRFLDGLDRESQIFDTSKPLLGAARRGEATSQVPPSLATLARATLMKPDTAGQITTTLNTVGPDAQAALQRLRDSADRLRSRTETGNLLGTAGAAGVGAAITPSPMQQQQPSQ